MGSFFLHPGMAWAAAGLASIPIIIHLINRRRFRRLDWAAMEFLLQALRRTRRRLRIEQLILLLLRVALMALLALALARPNLSSQGSQWLAGIFQEEEKVFILDDSFSTTATVANRTVLKRAVEALDNALEELAESGGNDRVTVIRASRFKSPLARRDPLDHERAARLREDLDKISPSDGKLGLADVLESLLHGQVYTDASGKSRPLSVSILTDLRETDWTDGNGNPDEQLYRALLALTTNPEVPARVSVLDLGNDAGSNVAITSAVIEKGAPVVDIPTEIRARVENYGDESARDWQLRIRYAAFTGDNTPLTWIELPGPAVGIVPARGAVEVSLAVTFRRAAPHVVYVELTGGRDSLPGDNSFPLAIDVAEAIDVLIINGETADESRRVGADFLSEALAIPGDESTGIRPIIVTEQELPTRELDRYTAIFLSNVFTLPTEFVALLRRYVEDGGALVTFLGEEIDPEIYNRDLAGGASGTVGRTPDATNEAPRKAGLLPARLGRERQNRENAPLSFVPDLNHAYLRNLREAADWFGLTHVYSYIPLEPLPAARVIIQFNDPDRSPAVVEHTVGKGRSLLVATDAGMKWNDWPRNATFPVMLLDLVIGLAEERASAAAHLVGTELTVPIDIADWTEDGRLRLPGYPSVPERGIRASPSSDARGSFHFTISDTGRSGHYGLGTRRREGEVRWRVFAMQRDERESDLRRITATRLENLYKDVELTIVKDTGQVADIAGGPVEIAELLLWMFFGLLFVEGFLAWWFAHHRAKSDGASEAHARAVPIAPTHGREALS